ncbi:MAG: hypothetical protein C0475_01810 [Planctomyces sp.]|nr:hypothetical protein [Planctomyces sp.]MBA4038916.1 hypothetical protein [Planctomyces sp.]MBA4119615.1 hypothetical protein [Isosphaera sp.]
MPIEWSERILVADLADEPHLSEELAAAHDRIASDEPAHSKDLVLNFTAVSYVSSSHLAQMLRLRKLIAERKRRLIVCGTSPDVMSVMTLTGLDRVFRFAQDPSTALASLQLED